MGKYLHGFIDSPGRDKRQTLNEANVGEDYENIPKRGKIRHEGTWRFKKASLDYKILQGILGRHVNEPYEVVYGDIAKLFKTGSLERKRIEDELVWMALPDAYCGRRFCIHDGIIRRTKRQGYIWVPIIS